jgi:hypothetical protein
MLKPAYVKLIIRLHFASVHMKMQFIAHLFYPVPYILDPKYASEIYSKISEYWKDVRDLPKVHGQHSQWQILREGALCWCN